MADDKSKGQLGEISEKFDNAKKRIQEVLEKVISVLAIKEREMEELREHAGEWTLRKKTLTFSMTHFAKMVLVLEAKKILMELLTSLLRLLNDLDFPEEFLEPLYGALGGGGGGGQGINGGGTALCAELEAKLGLGGLKKAVPVPAEGACGGFGELGNDASSSSGSGNEEMFGSIRVLIPDLKKMLDSLKVIQTFLTVREILREIEMKKKNKKDEESDDKEEN